MNNGVWIIIVNMYTKSGADPGYLTGGAVHPRSTSKKKGGSMRGSNFGPNVKKPT